VVEVINTLMVVTLLSSFLYFSYHVGNLGFCSELYIDNNSHVSIILILPHFTVHDVNGL